MEAFSLVQFLPPMRVEDGFLARSYQAGQPPVILNKKRDTPEEIKTLLNTILPPREFEHEGEVWRQCVSSVSTDRYTVATHMLVLCYLFSRQDVKDLNDLLDKKLEQRQARHAGICQVCGDYTLCTSSQTAI